MLRRLFLVVMCALGVVLQGLVHFAWMDARAQAAINPVCEKLLPAADVGKAARHPNVRLISPDPTIGAGGDCNYAIDGKTMVLLVTVNQSARPQDFQAYKGHEAYQTNQKAVPGVGDEAFTVDVVLPAAALIARKGNRLVALSAFVELDPTTGGFKGLYVSADQLVALARSMLAR
jgi:hypothetical protein